MTDQPSLFDDAPPVRAGQGETTPIVDNWWPDLHRKLKAFREEHPDRFRDNGRADVFTLEELGMPRP